MGTELDTMAQTDDQIVEVVTAALDYAVELSEEEEGWKVEKEEGNAVVKVKKNKEDRKVWLCTATVDIAPKVLWDKLLDTDNLTSWNTTLTQSKTIKKLPGDVKVTYQVTSEGGGGVVSARDFVYGSKTLVKDGAFIIGGMSVEVSELPEGSTCSWRTWQEQVCLVDGLRLQRVHTVQCHRDCHALRADADDSVHC